MDTQNNKIIKAAEKAAKAAASAAKASEKAAASAAKAAEKAAASAAKAAEKAAASAAKAAEADNNEEWTHVLTTNQICPDTTFPVIITTEQIKKCGKTWNGKSNQFEPRLLCKMDSIEKRPAIFKQYGIYIISITNDSYLLTRSNIYHSLVYDELVPVQQITKNADSAVLSIGNSETSVIDNLRYSGLFESESYLDEPIKFGSLLNGRHRCSFDTRLCDEPITVRGSQYETDGCFESANKILLIEGKSGNNRSFNIRQIYYPFRSIYDHTKGKKEIMPIFINTDKAGIIHIWKFTFEDPLVMTSIKCVTYNKYTFA